MAPIEDTATETLAAEQYGPLPCSLGHRPLEPLHRPLIDDRPEEYVSLGWVSHPDGAGLLDQTVHARRQHIPVHVDPRGSAALLILEAEPRPHHPFGRGIEIGAGEDHGCILAPQL